MHEMAITQDIVEAIVERMDGQAVTAVCLEIGKLSGVVPDSVRFCFDLVCAGTILEGAELEIVEPSGLARCRDCEVEFSLDDPIPLCACGSVNVEILAGRQLRITSVDVADQPREDIIDDPGAEASREEVR